MKLKLLAVAILLVSLILSKEVKYFQPFEYGESICFSQTETLEIFEALQLRPLYEQKIINLESKISNQNILIIDLESRKTSSKYKTFAIGFGSGVVITCLGVGIIVIKSLFYR